VRLELKIKIRPSPEVVGLISEPALLIGDPGFTGIVQGSLRLLRVVIQMSDAPKLPGRKGPIEG
jgi:hypothetical protein